MEEQLEQEIKRIAKSESYKLIRKIFDFQVVSQRRLGKPTNYAVYSSKGLVSTFDEEVDAYKEVLKLMLEVVI